MPTEESKVFISYSREDAKFARRLGKDLKSKGLNIWLDQLELRPGDDWESKVEDALEISEQFLIILSLTSVKSDNVRNELRFAKDEKKRIIPVLYQKCKIPLSLRQKQHSDFTKDYDEGFSDLLRAFDIADETSEREKEVERKHKPEGQRQKKKEPEKGKRVLKKTVTEETKNSFTDPRDGIIYRTVNIGDQIWMAENLRATKFIDGTDIPLVTSGKTWSDLSTPAYCCYDNDKSRYGSAYGALYNWHAVNTGKLCPTGWHIPSDEEWETLTDHLGGENIAGSKLKEAATTHWASTIKGVRATNESGFSALPGGTRNDNGTFNFVGRYGDWWSATEGDTYRAWLRSMIYHTRIIYVYLVSKSIGISVRCVRD